MESCITCGHQNPGGLDSCLNCGASLGTSCPVCGQAVAGGNKFCEQCGAALPDSQLAAAGADRASEVRQNLRALMPTALAQKISAAAGEILGEQREVTVLYVNVINTTDARRTPDNEDSYLLMDEALRLLVDVVYKYEGTIDKFTGDGLVALFGAPVAHENDPERAIRATLEMQRVLEPWQGGVKARHGFDFQMRIGINTGMVIAGKVGNDLHMEYTVIGETVNLAYHFQLVAEPGTSLVSPEVYQRTRGLFEFKAMPAVAINWLPQPIQTYEPLGLRARPERLGDRPRLPVPMIGRAQDLARLQNALSTVRQDHTLRVVLVTGEAGLGKSRLVEEFRGTIEPGQVRLFQGNCLTYARATPLWVVADLVRDMVGLSETDPDEVQRGAVQAHLDQLGLAQAEILPYVIHVLGLSQADPQLEARLGLLDAAMLQRQTHAALRQLLLAQAGLGPTVLIFEDLHWIDPASSDFLEYLVRTADEVPLLLLLVAREAGRQTGLHPLLSALMKEPERLVDLPLQALSSMEGQLLADQLIPQQTNEAWRLKQHLVARAEGNPFYVEEIIRMLIDQGGLVRSPTGGAWQVTPQAQELLKAVPGTVKGLILARFDRLPERLRWTLQKAAVLGTAFPVSLLQRLTRASSEHLSVQLDRLEARQFLRAAPFRSAPGYSYRHALQQEIIYSTLLKRDRRRIHSQVAEAIEHSSFWLPEEQAEILAYHYTESDRPGQAVPYLLTAAENAARRCAYQTAVVHYRQAMSLLPEQPGEQNNEYFRVRLGLGRSLKFAGEFAAASQVLSEALEYLWGWDAAADPAQLQPILVECLRQLADVRQRAGTYDEALTYLETGLQVLGQASTQAELNLWRSLLDRMAWIRFRQGQLAPAWELASQATADQAPTETEDPMRLASLYNTLGGVSWQQGQWTQSITFVERSLSLYESLGCLWGTAVTYGNLGILYYALGNWPKAAEYYERAYAVQQIIGNPEGQAVSFENLGLLHMAMGDHEQARQELESSLSIRQRLGDTWGTAQSYINLAHLALVQAGVEEAKTHLQTALSLAESIGSAEIKVPARWGLALVQAQQHELEKGLKSAEQALQLAQAARFTEGEIDSLRVLGILQGQAGHAAQAEARLQASVELSRKQHSRYRQGLALYELGRLYQHLVEVEQPTADQWRAKALTALDQAAHIFEALGANHDLNLTQLALAQI